MPVKQSRHAIIARRPTLFADRVGRGIVATKTAEHQKQLGIYLTPTAIADFIASMIEQRSGPLRILDPAAGSGTLLCAAIERLADRRDSADLLEVEIVAYEIDEELARGLKRALEFAAKFASARNLHLRSKVVQQDFLLAHAGVLSTSGQLFKPMQSEPFDLVVANPPYFKLAKSDARARAMGAVVHGQPNIYSLFMAVAAALLRDGGQMLFITPRSFASGPYFRLFRDRFFELARPSRVHVFDSRREAFERDAVLQENIILSAIRDLDWWKRRESFHLSISTSHGVKFLNSVEPQSIPLAQALDMRTPDRVLRVPSAQSAKEAVIEVESWPSSLHNCGLEISTGPVVPFRAIDLLDVEGDLSRAHTPLLWMQHVRAMRVTWPGKMRKPQYIKRNAASRSLLVPNKNYVLLRRFSAKEETHRLIAAPWLKRDIANAMIGIENHLNYIHRPGGELDEYEAWGLAALLNSSVLDAYFRASNGSTQVSATELRAMPMPTSEVLREIGRRVREFGDSIEEIDHAVRDSLSAGT
jgi:adenine-specific DNA-methyltransferase